MKDLKSHHYQFGDDDPNFISQSKQAFANGKGPAARLEDHLKKVQWPFQKLEGSPLSSLQPRLLKTGLHNP